MPPGAQQTGFRPARAPGEDTPNLSHLDAYSPSPTECREGTKRSRIKTYGMHAGERRFELLGKKLRIFGHRFLRTARNPPPHTAGPSRAGKRAAGTRGEEQKNKTAGRATNFPQRLIGSSNTDASPHQEHRAQSFASAGSDWSSAYLNGKGFPQANRSSFGSLRCAYLVIAFAM